MSASRWRRLPRRRTTLAEPDGAPSAATESALVEQTVALPHLHAAWRRVRANRGGDGVSLRRFEADLESNLRLLADEVRAGAYRPEPLLAVEVVTRAKTRTLRIPAVRDRVLQRAALDTLEPLCDPVFAPLSFGYRPGLGVLDAVAHVIRYRDAGMTWVLDADIAACFDRLDHAVLRQQLRRFLADQPMLELLERWIVAQPIKESDNSGRGIPLGSVVSPLFCNVTLHALDEAFRSGETPLIRYADDFVVLCRTQREAQHALRRVRACLEALRLTVNPEKTRVTSFTDGFTFLGVRFEQDWCRTVADSWTLAEPLLERSRPRPHGRERQGGRQ